MPPQKTGFCFADCGNPKKKGSNKIRSEKTSLLCVINPSTDPKTGKATILEIFSFHADTEKPRSLSDLKQDLPSAFVDYFKK